MAIELDFSTLEPLRKTRFKDKDVETRFAKVDPTLRTLAETIPATVTSSFRSPEENAAVGGVSNSFHTQGKALDYRKGELAETDRQRLASAGFDIIPESDHDHIQPSKNAPAKVALDFSTMKPLNDPNKGLFKEASPINKAAAFASGVSRAMPATRMAESITEAIGAPNQFEKFAKEAPGYEKGGRIVGDIAAGIPEYMAGMGAMKGLWGAGKLATLGKGAITNTVIGQLNRGADVDVGGSIVDAVTGAGGEALGMGLSAAGKSLKNVPSKLMNRAIGTPMKALEKGRENLGQELLDRGVWGTQKQLTKAANEGVNLHGYELDKALNKGGKIKRSIVADEMTALRNELRTRPLSDNDVAVTEKLMKEFWSSPKYWKMTASKANTLKREVDKMLTDQAFLKDTLPGKKEALMAMRSGLKKAIEDTVPAAKGINKELGLYKQLGKLMNKAQAKNEASRSLNLPRLGADAKSVLVGTLMGGIPGGGAGLAASEFARTTVGQTGTAQVLKYLAKLLQEKGGNAALAAPVVSPMINAKRKGGL